MIALLEPHLRASQTERGLVLEAVAPLPEGVGSVGEWLVRWARERPAVTFLAERDAGGAWARLSYASALARVEAIAGALLERGGRPDRPVMILSDNSVDSAMLALGAMHAGIPVAPISPAYSLLSTSFGRLREVAAQLEPGMIFADDPARFANALRALDLGVPLLSSGDLAALESAPLARATVGPDTIAKVLFTSGSTGRPKGVVNTQRMLVANQEMLAACWPFLGSTPPVVVDWLPWSHTFGGNHNFFLVLRNGGSLYLDRGRPAPGLIETTIANLAEISPTIWFNVPRGFDQAVAILERDRRAARAVFERLDVVFYAGAALSPATRARLERVAEAAGRPDVFFTSAWGSTETAPLATSAHFPTRTTGILGVPVPGVQLKLAPLLDRQATSLELRVRGPNVTPGYWRPGGVIEPLVLDEDGFLPTGDAGRLADEAKVESGVVFLGRLGENFKLSTGTWVSVAQVRLALIDACAPLLLDAAIAGQDCDGVRALLFLSPAAKQLPVQEVHDRLRLGIAAHNRAHPSTSERIICAAISTEPLSLDEGETTDKGYTNQRRVLERRRSEVDHLFTSPSDDLLVSLPP